MQVCEIPTIGFAIGPDWSTIVLDQRPNRDSLRASLELANAVVDQNRPVEVLFPAEGELEALPIRGALPEKEDIRVIRIEDFDWSPCGGTHCKSTSDVRLILVLGIRKEKSTYRLEFVCGHRAENVALGNAMAVSDVAALLDVGPNEVVNRTRALLDKARAQERTIEDLRDARLASDCERLLAESTADDGTIVVVLTDRTIQELRSLGHKLVDSPA